MGTREATKSSLGGPTSVAPLYSERRVPSFVRRESCEESSILVGAALETNEQRNSNSLRESPVVSVTPFHFHVNFAIASL
jgi:hypothetical protein